MRTLAGSGQAGFADGQGPAAHFNELVGLSLDTDGSLLVADFGNHAIRRVTMAGTVVGNEKLGFADGSGAAARFFFPSDIVVDGEGTIIVADRDNHRLHKIVGDQVTTLAGSSEAGTADGTGAGARFECPYRVALDERGRLLVAEEGKVDTLRVVEASQAPPLWMGPWRRPQQCYPMRPCYKRWRCCATMASWWGVASWRTWCWWWRGRDSPRAGGAKRVLPRAVPVGHA